MAKVEEPFAAPARVDWHALPVEAVAERLGTDPVRGLGAAEVRARQRRFGPNALSAEDRVPWWRVLLRQFSSALILILVAAAAVSLLIGDLVDTLAILAIVLFNGALGFVQEWRAEKAVEALQKLLSPHCRALRDGRPLDLDSIELVPGDLVELETGDRVPADIRLVEAVNLKADESMLTGESLSVEKVAEALAPETPLASRASMLWMGASVTNGHALGLVTATGMATEFGRIAALTESVGRDPTPLQVKLAQVGRQIGFIALAVSALLVLAGVALGRPLIEMFLTAVSLAVAVVPEGLPAVVTITLALGIRAMVRRRALLRRLQAAETLGAASVICTDKTGTLTKNEMTVTRVWLPEGELEVTGVGYEPVGEFLEEGREVIPAERPDLEALLETGRLCNHARLVEDEAGLWRPYGEPTEASLVVAAAKAGIAPEARTLSEFSFDSSRKRMTVVVEAEGGGRLAHAKGAPEVILERSAFVLSAEGPRPLDEAALEAARRAYRDLAERGLRVLALARRELPAETPLEDEAVEREFVLLGFVGIIDPPRAEVKDAIRLARSAGIRVIMITGDAPETARAIAERIGLSDAPAVTGSEIEGLDDAALGEVLSRDPVFARTTPEHKMRLVDLLQAEGQVVAMTGDGVNDAPALKTADIGIAMGLRGTDVARSASDMVLTDDNFASIVGAVEEGRRQYRNIGKFIRYLLSSNLGEVVAIFANILAGGPLILLPVQILWMNLVTDGPTALALGVEPAERDLMKRPPRKRTEAILKRAAFLKVSGLGLYIGLVTLFLFHHALDSLGPEVPQDMAADYARTLAFTGIIVLEKVNVLNFRVLDRPTSRRDLLSNPWIWAAIATALGFQLLAVYWPPLQEIFHTVPLDWRDWALIAAVALPIFAIAEAAKWVNHRFLDRAVASD